MTNEVIFRAIYSQDVDEATPKLETDKAKADTPTQTLTADVQGIVCGEIKQIAYRLNPTNVVTYTLMIFEAAKADDYESNSRLLYESDALRADDTDYEVNKVIPFKLDTEGTFYIATDWSAAAGNTKGYIRISGVAYI